MTLVHATPGDPWRAPAADAPDATLDAVYRPLATPVVVYAHIHRPYIRHLPGMAIANTGIAGLPYDGDPRASYLLLDDEVPAIRRVEYDIEKECGALRDAGRPGAAWTATMLRAGAFVPPSASSPPNPKGNRPRPFWRGGPVLAGAVADLARPVGEHGTAEILSPLTLGWAGVSPATPVRFRGPHAPPNRFSRTSDPSKSISADELSQRPCRCARRPVSRSRSTDN